MAFDKNEIMSWSAEEKRSLAFELLDSIDEEAIQHELHVWKKELIQQRIELDKKAGNEDLVLWSALREKYKR